MSAFTHFGIEEFWCDEYRRRPIAILNRNGRLHVYIDHVLQHNIVFDRGQDALAWLVQRIEQGVPAWLNWASSALELHHQDPCARAPTPDVRQRRARMMRPSRPVGLELRPAKAGLACKCCSRRRVQPWQPALYIPITS